MNVAWVIAVWAVRTKSSPASISGLPEESGLLAIAIFPSGFPVEKENTAAPAADGQHNIIASTNTDAVGTARPSFDPNTNYAPFDVAPHLWSAQDPTFPSKPCQSLADCCQSRADCKPTARRRTPCERRASSATSRRTPHEPVVVITWSRSTPRRCFRARYCSSKGSANATAGPVGIAWLRRTIAAMLGRRICRGDVPRVSVVGGVSRVGRALEPSS